MVASCLRALTAGFRSSKPYARLKRKLLYSRASAASQTCMGKLAEGLDALSRAILTLDHASSRAFSSLDSNSFCSTGVLLDNEGCPIRRLRSWLGCEDSRDHVP